MNVLVSGASGFVAGHLIPKLLEKDNNVIAFVRRRSDGRISPVLMEMKNIYGDKLNIVRGDIINFHDVVNIVDSSDPEIIFHLASQSFVPDSVTNPDYTHQVNGGGTLNILEAVRYWDVKKIIYTSSSEIYGFKKEEELPLDEDSRPNPQSPYASAKLYGEWLAKNYYSSYNLPTVITRAFNHEGPGRGHHFVTASIVRQLVAVKKGETDRIFIGNLDVTRDWSHVSDIVDAYILLAEKGEPGQTYVIGSGKQTSISDFISRTAFLLSIENFRVFQDPNLVRKVDVPRLQSNPKKMMSLGWTSKRTLDDIITEMISFYYGMSRKQREAFEPKHLEGPELLQPSSSDNTDSISMNLDSDTNVH